MTLAISPTIQGRPQEQEHFGEHRRGSTVWCCLLVCFVFKLKKEYTFEWLVMGEGSEKSWGIKKIYGQNVLYGHIESKNYNNKRK